MSSCNDMLLGREIATYRGTKCNVCMMIMQNDTYFTRKLCRWQTPSWFFKLICRVLFAYVDYLLRSFRFKTCQFGGSQV